MLQDLTKHKLPPGFRGRNVFLVQLWWIVQVSFFAWSPQIFYRWRSFLLTLFGASIGKNVVIRPSVKVTYPWKLHIGDNSWIGDDVVLYTLGEIRVGDNAVISQKCYLCTGSHDYKKDSFDIFAEPITVENEVWLATDVYVAPGVTIGRGAVVGARSSVFGDIPSEMVCVGSPAVPIRHRSD